jgi:mannosyltransferase OCH1-like enzyme
MDIPHCIHQIWIQGADALPRRYRAGASTWVRRNAGWTHQIWDEVSLRGLMLARAPEWWDVYARQPEVEAKADVARYAVLDTLGGLYADIDTECRRPVAALLESSSARLHTTFYSWDMRAPIDCATNSVVASAPGHPIWPLVLRQVAVNGLHITVVCRTGPEMLRPILRRYAEENPGQVGLIGYPHAITTFITSRLALRAISRVRRENCILDFNDSARRAARPKLNGHSLLAFARRTPRRLFGRG